MARPMPVYYFHADRPKILETVIASERSERGNPMRSIVPSEARDPVEHGIATGFTLATLRGLLRFARNDGSVFLTGYVPFTAIPRL